MWNENEIVIKFSGLDNENSYTHVSKFYKIVVLLGALEYDEEAVFL